VFQEAGPDKHNTPGPGDVVYALSTRSLLSSEIIT